MRQWRWILAVGGGLGILGGLLGWASGGTPSGAVLVETDLTGVTPRVIEPGDSLTLVSWNIHYGGGPTLAVGRGQSRAQVTGYLDAIAHQLRRWDPDIVALQEVDRGAVRSFDIDQLRWLQRAVGLPYAAWTTTWDAKWIPHPGLDPRTQIGRVHSGQAILSRFPLTDPIRHDLPQPPKNSAIYNLFYLHRALLEVTVQLGAEREMRIVNAHLEAFHSDNRMWQADRIATILDNAAPHTVLLGDMNCVPPEAEVRRAFPDEPQTDMSADDTIRRIRAIDGLNEVVPDKIYALHESPWFTFPAHAPNRRLDYLFHGTGLALATAQVPQLDEPPSDHLPVVATFRLD